MSDERRRFNARERAALFLAADGKSEMSGLPLETNAWKHRVHRGKVYEHARFIDFITTKPMAGCGWQPEKVEALIKDDAETLTLWREAVVSAPGGDPSNHDNVMIGRQGNSKAYTLERLKREDPRLFQRVVDGELSANAAAIEAGFRKKPSAFEQIQKLIPKLSAKERRALLEMLRQ